MLWTITTKAIIQSLKSKVRSLKFEVSSGNSLWFLAYEISFRIYNVDNCNVSSIREEVSKKIKTCTFKSIQLQFPPKDPMVNKQKQNSTTPPFFCAKWYNQAVKTNDWPPKIPTLRLRKYLGCLFSHKEQAMDGVFHVGCNYNWLYFNFDSAYNIS